MVLLSAPRCKTQGCLDQEPNSLPRGRDFLPRSLEKPLKALKTPRNLEKHKKIASKPCESHANHRLCGVLPSSFFVERLQTGSKRERENLLGVQQRGAKPLESLQNVIPLKQFLNDIE